MRFFLKTATMLLALLLLISCVTGGESRVIEEEPVKPSYINHLMQSFAAAFKDLIYNLNSASVRNNGKLDDRKLINVFDKYAVRNLQRGVNEEESVENGIRAFDPSISIAVLVLGNAAFVVLRNLWHIISGNGIVDYQQLGHIWNFIVTIVTSIFSNIQ